MCTTVLIRDSRAYLETVGDLLPVVGKEGIVWDELGPGVVPDESWNRTCLCPVDIEATFERAGYKVRSGWGQPDGFTDYEVLPA